MPSPYPLRLKWRNACGDWCEVELAAGMVHPDSHARLIVATTAEADWLRGGSGLGPYRNCTDCGRAMVWQGEPTEDTTSGSWMCPNCVLRELDKARETIERLTGATRATGGRDDVR